MCACVFTSICLCTCLSGSVSTLTDLLFVVFLNQKGTEWEKNNLRHKERARTIIRGGTVFSCYTWSDSATAFIQRYSLHALNMVLGVSALTLCYQLSVTIQPLSSFSILKLNCQCFCFYLTGDKVGENGQQRKCRLQLPHLSCWRVFPTRHSIQTAQHLTCTGKNTCWSWHTAVKPTSLSLCWSKHMTVLAHHQKIYIIYPALAKTHDMTKHMIW